MGWDAFSVKNFPSIFPWGKSLLKFQFSFFFPFPYVPFRFVVVFKLNGKNKETKFLIKSLVVCFGLKASNCLGYVWPDFIRLLQDVEKILLYQHLPTSQVNLHKQTAFKELLIKLIILCLKGRKMSEIKTRKN